MLKKKKDLITELTGKLYSSYITSFTIDEFKGLSDLKKLYYNLKTTTYPSSLQKDIKILKVDASERIFRYYKIQKSHEIDSLIKYNFFHTNEIIKIKDDLALTKMYLMKAYIATRLQDNEQAKKNIEKTLNKPLDYYNQKLLSEIYYLQGNFKESISILENSNYIKNLSVNSPSCPFLSTEFLFLANSYQKLGNYKKSYYYYYYYDNHVTASKGLSEIFDSVSYTIKKKEILTLSKELNTLKHQIKYYTIIFLTIVTLVIIFLIFYSKHKKNNSKLTKQLASKKASNFIKKEIIEHILGGLKKLEKEKYYLNKECNAYNTAKKIKTNTTYLSIVVNSHYQKSFNGYINDLRINFVLDKLQNDKRFRLYNIQSITEEIGYKSSDSFIKYFKQHTGLLPSSYIKRISIDV